jgi:hypothetical protein
VGLAIENVPRPDKFGKSQHVRILRSVGIPSRSSSDASEEAPAALQSAVRCSQCQAVSFDDTADHLSRPRRPERAMTSGLRGLWAEERIDGGRFAGWVRPQRTFRTSARISIWLSDNDDALGQGPDEQRLDENRDLMRVLRSVDARAGHARDGRSELEKIEHH